MRLLGLVLGFALLVRPLAAQPYDLAWHTIDGGGATSSTGGSFVLSATIGQPDAGGPFAGGPHVLHAGFWAFSASGTATPQADLSITKTDGQTSAMPGQVVTYAIVAGNAGPSAVTGATVTDVLPAVLSGASWTCTATAGSSCPPSGSGGINHPVALLVGGSATFVLTATLSPAATGTLANTASVTAPAGVVDPGLANNSATDTDTLVLAAKRELLHGTLLRTDLAGVAGFADVDLYRLRQEPHASYEVVLDETSGDIGTGSGPALERVAADGLTVLQGATAVGAGPSRSLRFQNTTASAVVDQLVRVRSQSCGSDCGADDVYRLRAWETTLSIARFNNSASQVTVVILQNRMVEPVGGRMYFWTGAGTLAHEQTFSLAPRATLVTLTAGIAALAGQSGSVTVAHDGPHGAVAGKAVALEPATGFSFDSPLETRRR